jgi:hypothetical protein
MSAFRLEPRGIGSFLFVATLLLSGCETVVFEAPPVAAQACDPALVGHWLSVADKPAENGEVELRIATDCTLLFVEHEKGVTREGAPTTLHVGRDGRIAYAWVDARWAEVRMALSDAEKAPAQDKPSQFAAGDIVLMQYRVAARRLELRNASPKPFAHRIIDGKLKGDVRTDGDDLAVRVRAPVDPRQLRDPALFPRGEMRFERAAAND